MHGDWLGIYPMGYAQVRPALLKHREDARSRDEPGPGESAIKACERIVAGISADSGVDPSSVCVYVSGHDHGGATVKCVSGRRSVDFAIPDSGVALVIRSIGGEPIDGEDPLMFNPALYDAVRPHMRWVTGDDAQSNAQSPPDTPSEGK